MKRKKPVLIELPAEWDEMTPDDWKDAMLHRQQFEGKRVSVVQLRTLTARDMLTRRGMRISTGNSAHMHLVAQMASTLSWLWQQKGDNISLVWDSAAQPMPQVTLKLPQGRRETVYGPVSYGADLLFGEYREAQALVRAIDEDAQHADELLAELAGLLWRPVDELLLNRLPYEQASPQARRERGMRLKPWQRQTALMWLEAFTRALSQDTFVISGEEVCFAPLFQKETQAADSSASAGLFTIGLAVAESGVFGTMPQVDHTPLLDVMLKLLRDKEKLDKLNRAQAATTKPSA